MSAPTGMLAEFHEAFGFTGSDAPRPMQPDEGDKLRMALLREEFQEYIDAERGGDLIGVADALADMVYVIYGTAYTYRIPLDAVLAEVHRSNMSKLGPDGRPTLNAVGKAMKGPRYSPPDIAAILAVDVSS